MIQQKLISFIIPMYNAEKYISQCLYSIYEQDLNSNDYEIVIIDDGSTDQSFSIVENQRKDNIRLFRQQNKGQSAARNRGLEMAMGRYIHFIDADDILVPHSLKQILNTAIDNELDVASFNMLHAPEDEAEKLPIDNSGHNISDIMEGDVYIEKYNYNNGPWWYIVNKECLNRNKLKFVEGKYGEDGMFTMELLMKVNRIAHVDKACYVYVRHPSTTTTRRDLPHQCKMLDDYLFVYNHMQKLIDENRQRLSDKAIERCKSRSESYLFFLLLRLLKYPLPGEVAIRLKGLKKQGLYPIKKPYDGIVYTLASFTVNHYYLMRLGNFIYTIFYRLRPIGI